MDIKVNGAEWFQDASDSLMLLAGKQVTDGINNFINFGLTDVHIKNETNWVKDRSTPMTGNSGFA